MAKHPQKKPMPPRGNAVIIGLLPPGEKPIFGAAPLIYGEDPATYQALLVKVAAATAPQDILEEIWVREMVDLLWETLRLRRLKASLLDSSMADGLEDILTSLGGRSFGFSLEDRSLVEAWANGDAGSRKSVVQRLAKAGLSMDAVVAAALSKKLDEFERIDRMIASAEARRNNTLREIDRHRTTLGAALRAAMEEPEDAAFIDAETGLVANSPPQ
jgi:hypothetical protein